VYPVAPKLEPATTNEEYAEERKRGEFVSRALVQYKEKSESADLDLRERTEVRLVRIAKQPAALTTEQR